MFREAAAAGVARAAFISIADFKLPGNVCDLDSVTAYFRGGVSDSVCAADAVLSGYFKGKRYAEQVLSETFPDSGVALRPGFIHGTRQVGSIGIPLSAVGEHRVPSTQHQIAMNQSSYMTCQVFMIVSAMLQDGRLKRH